MLPKSYSRICLAYALLLLASCSLLREPIPVPPLLRPAPLATLEQQAQLPPYLVPPPPQATPRQVKRWTDAQTQALATSNAQVGKVKLKNVGNTEATVQQGITGQQLTTAFAVIVIFGLAFWLKPWRR